jgi:cysteine synthase B
MIRDAEARGLLDGGRVILDSTSGNIGIALAQIGAALGHRVTLCMPVNASSVRKELLRLLGAELILTDPLEGDDGARAVAAQPAADQPDRYVYLDQYGDPMNWRAHYDMAYHGIEGTKHYGSTRVPAVFDPTLVTRQIDVSTEAAQAMARRLSREEGLPAGVSGGASVAAAIRLAGELEDGVIVTVLPDPGPTQLVPLMPADVPPLIHVRLSIICSTRSIKWECVPASGTEGESIACRCCLANTL